MTNSAIDLGIVFKKLVKAPYEVGSTQTGAKYFIVPRHPYSKFDRWFSRFMARPLSEKPLKEYLRIVEEYKPDAILFFGTEADFPLIIPHLTVPSIIWFQGNLTVYDRMYEKGIAIRETISHERWKDRVMGDTLWHRYLNFKKLVVREKRIFSLAQNFVGRTDWDRRLVQIMAPQANYHHCDEPLRRPFWENSWSHHENRDRYIITTTIQDNLYKGLETVFETCDLLAGKLEKHLEWRIIGIPEGTAYVKATRKKAHSKLSSSCVRMMGRLTGKELVQELLNADLYVHPSHIENSPNGVQEAMLLGMPVIATNVGGTPSLMVDGHEGILVQNYDPYALAGAILDLYRSPANAEKMGENARNRALIRNNPKSICKDLLEIFHKVMA